MIQAIIFDMDGLLIDSEPLWQQAEIEVLTALGVPLTPTRCLETTGLRIDEAIDYWYQRFPWNPAVGGSVQAVAAQVTQQVIALIQAQGQAKPGVQHAIEWARRSGRALALASSSPYALIHATLSRLGLVGVFAVVYSAQEEAYGKPHPAVYLTTAKKLGVPPESCLALEDSLNGVLAAKAAKMKCIAVPEAHNLHDPRFAIADTRLTSLLELRDDLR